MDKLCHYECVHYSLIFTTTAHAWIAQRKKAQPPLLRTTIDFKYSINFSGVARILVRGDTLGVSRVAGPGSARVVRGRSPPDAEEFSKIFKNFLVKIAKMHYFSIFSKHLTNHGLIFRAFGRKTRILGKF